MKKYSTKSNKEYPAYPLLTIIKDVVINIIIRIQLHILLHIVQPAASQAKEISWSPLFLLYRCCLLRWLIVINMTGYA